jgi:hypothetical protein
LDRPALFPIIGGIGRSPVFSCPRDIDRFIKNLVFDAVSRAGAVMSQT